METYLAYLPHTSAYRRLTFSQAGMGRRRCFMSLKDRTKGRRAFPARTIAVGVPAWSRWTWADSIAVAGSRICHATDIAKGGSSPVWLRPARALRLPARIGGLVQALTLNGDTRLQDIGL